MARVPPTPTCARVPNRHRRRRRRGEAARDAASAACLTRTTVTVMVATRATPRPASSCAHAPSRSCRLPALEWTTVPSTLPKPPTMTRPPHPSSAWPSLLCRATHAARHARPRTSASLLLPPALPTHPPRLLCRRHVRAAWRTSSRRLLASRRLPAAAARAYAPRCINSATTQSMLPRQGQAPRQSQGRPRGRPRERQLPLRGRSLPPSIRTILSPVHASTLP